MAVASTRHQHRNILKNTSTYIITTMALPPLSDLLRGSSHNKRLRAPDVSFDDDGKKRLDDAPSAQEVARLYKRACESVFCDDFTQTNKSTNKKQSAHKRVRLSVPKAQRAVIVSWMDHFEAYGKASCRRLCQTMHDRLPRELRDIVYESLISGSMRDVSAAGGSDCEPIHTKNQAHYWRPEYAGKQMITELLETWYQSTRLHLGLDIGFLETFLFEKVDFLDIPRHRVISQISITLDRRDLVSCRHEIQNEGEVKTFSPHKRLLGRLEALFLLREGASIHIYPYRPNTWTEGPDSPITHNPQKRLLQDITTPIFDTLRRLKHAGYVIAVAIGDKPLYTWSPHVQFYHLEVCKGDESDDNYIHPQGEAELVWRTGVLPIQRVMDDFMDGIT